MVVLGGGQFLLGEVPLYRSCSKLQILSAVGAHGVGIWALGAPTEARL